MCWNTMLMICAGIQCWWYAGIQCWWYAGIQCWYVLKYNADDMLEYNADDVLEYNADDMLEHNVTKHKHQKVLKFMRWHQTYNHQTQQCGASLWLWPWIFLGKINVSVLQNIPLGNESLWCNSITGLCGQKILNLFRRLWDTQPLFQSSKCSSSMRRSPMS